MNLQLASAGVFVAGSSRGLGRAIAEAFLAEGARVAITGRDAPTVERARKELAETHGETAVLGHAGDMSDTTELTTGIDRARAAFGRIDAAIANIGNGRLPASGVGEAALWDRALHENLHAALALARVALPALRETGGSLTFIGSIAGCEALGAPPAYEAAKAALRHTAKALARQLGPSGVRVNIVAPGNIFAPGGTWDLKRREDPAGVDEYIRREVPLGRFATPAEVAAGVVFLASRAAAFVTGATLVIDGGQTRSL